jgi:hypothetical protein
VEAGEAGKMLSSQITDELKLVAYPVGGSSEAAGRAREGGKRAADERN